MLLFKIHEPTIYIKSSECMEEIENEAVQLIITSPPYGKIKDYGIKEQIGFSDSFTEYFNRLKRVWKECYRVLEPQCRLVINVGDQYLRKTEYGRYRIVPIACQIIQDCVEVGFDFLGDIIWQKVSTTKTTGGCSLMGSIYYPRNGLLTYDYEHILIFKKHEGKGSPVSRERKELSKIPLSEWKKWYTGHWRFSGVLQKEHIAMFPEELPYRLIRMFSFIGDTVLDPFLGSGTTLKVAKSLFRKGIGYEINSAFKDTIDTKIAQSTIGYFKDYQYIHYKLYKKTLEEPVEFDFETQKQKGITILKNSDGLRIIIDYLSLDIEKYDADLIIKELKLKFQENSIVNYLKSKESRTDFINYIIVLNSPLANKKEFMDCINDYINAQKYLRNIQVISLETITSNKMKLSELFRKKNESSILQVKGKSKDILSFID
ncbi:MAG: DNA-methyltransferase [Promethearchaeota archaeon]